jgi:diguanylate cyclase (GGDEF)-like protein/PAS domain S-box-containing protein
MGESGEPSTSTIAVVQDITKRKQAEESMQLAALVYKNSSEAMMVTDANNRILSINSAFTKVTGYTLDEVVGRDPNMLGSGQQNDAFYKAMWQEITVTGDWQGEILDVRKNGETYAKWLTISTIYKPDGAVDRRVALFTDITKMKASEDLIWQQANFDALTGLPNRRMFHDRLEQEIKKAQRGNLVLAVMFLDLDRFKEVNDTFGHDKGDLLLQEAAQRLKMCVRETDTIARLGGDEFTIILGEMGDPNSIERISQEILHKLAEPYQLNEDKAYVSASIGITLYPADATDIDMLLKNADQAMYAAKAQGRNRYHYFTQSMQEAAQAKMRMTSDLRGALAGKQFCLHYQPIIELATGNIHKAEGLIRWDHPTRGLISPMDFIPIAEETGMIVEIGNWVFFEAVKQVKQWRKFYNADFQVSINKSPAQFLNSGKMHEKWIKHLRDNNLPGQCVAIEITEGLLLDAGVDVSTKLLAFRDAGIQVAIDDFGTGYSSLAYLKKFDIDYVKIDRSFVQNLGQDSSDITLCEAIIVMAHTLDLKVVAEGIETEQQRDLLTGLGCDYGQGFLFAKPALADEFEIFLKNASH